MIGNEEDFTACLGYQVPNTSEDLSGLGAENFKAMISQVTSESGFAVVATTLRAVVSASVHDWGGHSVVLSQRLRRVYASSGSGDL